MRRIRIVLPLLLSVFVSCETKSAGDVPSSGDVPVDMVRSVKVTGDLKADKIIIDNPARKITIDFPEGSFPVAVVVSLELADGVSMSRPAGLDNTFDLTQVVPIYLAYGGSEYRYLIVANYTKQDGGTYMKDGEVFDMSLLYYGGEHRTTTWDTEQLQANVSYTDDKGDEHYLFDSFLFLEMSTGNGRYFESGFDTAQDGANGARKSEWKGVLDKYFDENGPISRLDAVLSNASMKIGTPKFKRRLIIFVPAAFWNQTDWGELDGELMDFAKSEHRIKATCWYVNYALNAFNRLNCKYLAFDGFYFVSEQLTNNMAYLPSVADYIKSQGYNFYWIPYWGSDGMTQWKSMHFDRAFLQPNYFFPEQKPEYPTFFESVISTAKASGMSLEFEFDERALKSCITDNRSDRFWDYLDAFGRYGVTDNTSIAYYQGDCTLYSLKVSQYEDDKKMYDALCSMIVKRQQKRGEK